MATVTNSSTKALKGLQVSPLALWPRRLPRRIDYWGTPRTRFGVHRLTHFPLTLRSGPSDDS
jgi:hypothetical protein